jgi:Resolvase, N terminal domain
MPSFIAYYRVSTDRQGASGLGLDAQRHAVVGFIGHGKLMAEYTEIESGKRQDNRPQLLAAIERCRKHKAVLVIAKLDRLARDVHFIVRLWQDGVNRSPFADKLRLWLLLPMIWSVLVFCLNSGAAGVKAARKFPRSCGKRPSPCMVVIRLRSCAASCI